MNLINKLKSVAGFRKEKLEQSAKQDYCRILKDDSIDVVFAKKLIQKNGNFFYCDTQDNLIKTIQGLMNKININSMYCTEKILQELLNKIPINYNDDYASCDAIISSCEYLIADHGKVMLSSKQLGPHNIKNLPKEHIIIAYTSQIVKNLNDSMSGINTRYIDNLPSTITTITSSNEEKQQNLEGNIKNLSVILIEDYNTKS